MSETLQDLIHKAPNVWDSGASVVTTNRLSHEQRLKRLIPYDERSSGNMALRRSASKLLEHYLPKLATRLIQCRQVPHGQTDVELWGDGNGKAHFRGLKTCGSVWTCPDCSQKICAARKGELDKLLQYWRGNGVSVFMMTLTVRHGRTDKLVEILETMKKAWVTVQQRCYWREQVLPRRDGSVTATEVTYGANGWHPHFHIIIGMKIDVQQAEELLNEIRAEWQDACDKYLLDASRQPAFDLRRADEVGVYVSKFGAAEEMTMGLVKVGRKGSVTPWQLQRLAEADDDPVMRRHYGFIWREYALAFHGKRQLVWSKGLKALAKIDDVKDDEIAASDEAESPGEVVVRRWSADGDSWRYARKRHAALLRAAAYGADLKEAEFGPTDAEAEERWRSSVGRQRR